MIRGWILAAAAAVPAVATAGPAPSPLPPAAHRRLVIGAEVFAAGTITRAEGDTLSAFDVGRAETGAELDFHPALSAGLRLEAIRSTDAGGTVGIDGDSLVFRLKRAQITGHVAAGGAVVSGDAGMIADPWIEQAESGYPLRALAPTASEALLGWDASDLGARAIVDVGPVHAAIAVGNGEGRRFPERNDGKDVTGVVDVRALDTAVAGWPVALHVRAVARDGSIGPASTRDRRFGGGLLVRSGDATAGAEVVRALGLAGRGEVEGTALGTWVAVPIWRRLGLAGRWSALRVDRSGASHAITGALGYDVVAPAASRSVRAFVAVEWDRDRITAPGAAADAIRFLVVIAASGTAALEVP